MLLQRNMNISIKTKQDNKTWKLDLDSKNRKRFSLVSFCIEANAIDDINRGYFRTPVTQIRRYL